MEQFGHVPAEGEWFQRGEFRVEIIDMDGHRVDKVLLMRGVPPAGGSGGAAEKDPSPTDPPNR